MAAVPSRRDEVRGARQPFSSSLPLGKIAGTRVEFHWSWLIIFVLVAWTLAEGAFPAEWEGWSTATYWLVGIAAALLFFASVLAHELAHSIVANRRGLPVRKITLFVFGGVSQLEDEPRTPGDEFAITVVGPATSIIIGAVAWAISPAFSGVSEQAFAIFAYIGSVSILVGIFNLMPGFPLDGGRLLRAALWKRSGDLRQATKTASRVGQGFAYVLMAAGVFILLFWSAISGLWFLLIGWFLLNSARSAYEQLAIKQVLEGVHVSDVMGRDVHRVPPDLPLDDLVHQHFVRHNERAVLVTDNGHLLGLVSVTDVKDVDRSEWPLVSASRVMTPREKLVVTREGDELESILNELGRSGLNQMPVLDGEEVVGMISRRELIEQLQMRLEVEGKR